MKLGIFGSRTLKDERVKLIILEKIRQLHPEAIITTQEPAGVCEVAQRMSKELAIPLELHFLNFKYLRGAFERRSKDVIRMADYVLLIHDGKSQGTANEYKLVKKSGKPHDYQILEALQDQRNNGFNIKDDWSIKDAQDIQRFEFEINDSNLK